MLSTILYVYDYQALASGLSAWSYVLPVLFDLVLLAVVSKKYGD